MQPVSCAGCQALQRRLDDLQAENERLRRQLDEATRAGKRHAGPFSKGAPKANRKRPGRKPGKDYGTKAHRQPPSPETLSGQVHWPPPHTMTVVCSTLDSLDGKLSPIL
jgi:transposase